MLKTFIKNIKYGTVIKKASNHIKLEQYEEACDCFIQMGTVSIIADIDKENSGNSKLLIEYMSSLDFLDMQSWKKVAYKAESLELWKISEYAYREYLFREENFFSANYFLVGFSLFKQKKYKEAVDFFKQQDDLGLNKIRQFFNYQKSLDLQHNVIVYESNGAKDVSSIPYEIFLYLKKDILFDNFKHIWVINDKNKIPKELLLNKNYIFISKKSNLYLRYLASAKYLVHNKKLASYFESKKGQIEVDCSFEGTFEKYVKKNFFSIIDSNIQRLNSCTSNDKSSLEELYCSAISDFNNQKYKESFDKFEIVKKKPLEERKGLPLLYYREEARLQYLLHEGTKSMEQILVYMNHKFNAENFAGVEWLLENAMNNSKENKEAWSNFKIEFSKLVEDIKGTDVSLWTSLKSENFINKIEKLSKVFSTKFEADYLSYHTWFLFANLFIFAREYTAYYWAREKAIKSVLASTNKSSLELFRYKIRAMIEEGYETKYDLLRAKLLDNKRDYIQKNLLFLGNSEYYFGRKKLGEKFFKESFSEKEQSFAQYIKGKSVALVGPIESGLKLGEEIDSFDVVLRFNYIGLEKFSKEEFGSKTDVSIYIPESLDRNTLDATKIIYLNQLNWVIIDTGHNEKDICFTGVTVPIRKRFAASNTPRNTLFKATPSGIQRTLMDILRFEVGEIKVFNTNLFLENNYAKAYRSRGTLGADYLNFFWHDPISNFVFLKKLQENNIFNADDLLLKILKMSKYEYVKELEKSYGNKKK